MKEPITSDFLKKDAIANSVSDCQLFLYNSAYFEWFSYIYIYIYIYIYVCVCVCVCVCYDSVKIMSTVLDDCRFVAYDMIEIDTQ